MIKQLKKRLLFLYIFTTGLLLTIIIVILFLLNKKQFTENNIKNFEYNVRTVVEEITSKNSVSYSWITKMEVKNKLIVAVSSNSIPIHFYGSFHPPTNRQELFEKLDSFVSARDQKEIQNDLNVTSKTSDIYSFYGTQGEHYYGVNYTQKSFNKSICISVIQWMEEEKENMAGQILFFTMINIIGLIAVYFISLFIVNKSIEPLKEGIRRQNEFIAAASHELRSPLTVIMAGMGALKIKNSVLEEIIPRIEYEGERMKKLIEDMLSIASSDAKTWVLNREKIEMESFIITLYESLCELCKEKKQKLKLDLPEGELLPFVGDRLRMEQILIILVDNACSYSKEESAITIKLIENKKYLTIEVIDYGNGIKDEDKKRIFDRFYRSDHSRNDKKHFGLGLSIAKELVCLHKGRISVKDTEGGGSTFIVELPVIK